MSHRQYFASMALTATAKLYGKVATLIAVGFMPFAGKCVQVLSWHGSAYLISLQGAGAPDAKLFLHLIAAQFVKAYIKNDKNCRLNAVAIFGPVSHPPTVVCCSQGSWSK